MKLNFKKYGEGEETLLILHGLFGMLDNWTTLARQFAAHYTVYTIDLRNHGKSAHSNEMSYELMANDLLEFMDEHQLYTANIIGHSMGGKTVMAFTDLYPERVERMVVVDIAPKRYAPKHSEIIHALQDLPIDDISSRSEAETWLQTRIDEEGVRLFLLKNLQRTGNGFGWKMNLPALVAHYEEIIGDVKLSNHFERPVLVLKGAQSNYIDSQDEEDFEAIYDNLRIVAIPGAGHWVHAEQPALFYEQTLSFLQAPLY
ncbi:alpha/beta fold hydrolase [bacterium]|nr:alpha/beta fold hydrolase [bacterium]